MSIWTVECDRYEQAALELHHAAAELKILNRHARELGWSTPLNSVRQEAAVRNLAEARRVLAAARTL